MMDPAIILCVKRFYTSKEKTHCFNLSSLNTSSDSLPRLDLCGLSLGLRLDPNDSGLRLDSEDSDSRNENSNTTLVSLSHTREKM